MAKKHNNERRIAMMREAYCSFEVSKLLKEKGFGWECCGRYSVRSKEFHLDCTRRCNNSGLFEYAAPTHQMAMAWLREVHNLHIEIARGPKGYHIMIEIIPLGVVKYITREIVGTNYVDSYEEAIEAALKFILKNLI